MEIVVQFFIRLSIKIIDIKTLYGKPMKAKNLKKEKLLLYLAGNYPGTANDPQSGRK